ncbi:TIGR02444 family protein [Enterovibrio makurazakiensis]|uniref:TIGR02444 family protein n=1 Tax=Enterovibrio gelatinilyticus TaxID=2899819 RepID=A0ABT5R6R8_9GAMM|nr:TIGR02444 family protein [Enterovibrio sp. ZSDZ42]MDD1795900.1 TIGR02444 family protein [Enterovibrio sp. ZSDZ42]
MDGSSRTTGSDGSGVPKPIKNNATANGLWQFCLHHYGKQEVKHASLKLQDTFKGNVNLVLLLAWLEDAGFMLSAHSLAALRQSLTHSETLLTRYRLMRRELKPQLSRGAYQKMLNYELTLEKFQQQELLTCINQQPWLDTGPSAVELYCEQLDIAARYLYPTLMKGLSTR